MPVDLPDDFDMSTPHRQAGAERRYPLINMKPGEKKFFSREELDIDPDAFRSYCHNIARLRRNRGEANLYARTMLASYPVPTPQGDQIRVGIAVEFYIRPPENGVLEFDA